MKRVVVIAAVAAAVSSSAQVVLVNTGTYSQNFDSLASGGTGIAWTNNLPTALMPGWYSSQTTYDADDGTVPVSGQYSYGVASSGERALGSTALQGALIRYGIRLNNASGSVFTGLNLDYTGEQWRSGAALTDKLIFEYSTNATSLFTGAWNPVTALDFNSPNNTGVGVLNGELPTNRSFQSSSMTGLSWLNGTDMWVRWTHVGNASRHALSIDDLHLNPTTAVPEPYTLATMGVACLGLAALRRRRSRSTAMERRS